MSPARHRWIPLLYLGLTALFYAPIAPSGEFEIKLSPWEHLRRGFFSAVQVEHGTHPDGSGIYLLAEQKLQRVLLLSGEGKLRGVRRGSASPTGPSDLESLGGAEATSEGLVHVADRDNRRLTVYDAAGAPRRSFNLPRFTGFALTGREIWTAAPDRDGLLAVYSSQGDLLRKVGEPLAPESFFGLPSTSNQTVAAPELAAFLNRVDVEATAGGGVIIAFAFTPVLRRYDAQGRLKVEGRLTGTAVERLVGSFQSNEPTGDAAAVRVRGIDGQLRC